MGKLVMKFHFHKHYVSVLIRDLQEMISGLLGKLQFNRFPHKHNQLQDSVQLAELIGPAKNEPFLGSSDAIAIGILKVPKDVWIPQHAEEAVVILHIIEAGEDAKIGPTEDFMESIQSGKILSFSPTAPKVIKVKKSRMYENCVLSLNIFQAGSKSDLLLIYARSLHLEGRFWYSPTKEDFPKEFEDVMDIDNIHKYYLNFAKNYEQVMMAWGYCMPETTADAIISHGGIQKDSFGTMKVLDLGCGDGLTGKALKNRGFEDITGVDFSAPMIEKSTQRGCYQDLKLVDLLKDLPFEDGVFNLLVSTAVTTYLSEQYSNKLLTMSDWINLNSRSNSFGEMDQSC